MLIGSKVTLTEIRIADSAKLLTWINDPETVRLSAAFAPVHESAHLDWLASATIDASRVVFAIRKLPQQELIGVLQLIDIHPVHRTAELIIRIGPEAERGRGYGTEAVELATSFAFRDRGLQRLWLKAFRGNERATSAYRKARFEQEGILRRSRFIDGEWRDEIVMARLADGPMHGQDGSFDEFTETGFRQILNHLKTKGYRFAFYGEGARDKHVLWRHDVDFSMHRSLKLAEIEAEVGVSSTYFLHLRSPFYSLLEPEVAKIAARIEALGHRLGLHFDASAYGISSWDAARLSDAVAKERRLLEAILGITVTCVSWHNPDQSNLLEHDEETIAGLTNAYSASLRNDYVYSSDSNGYWRHRPMLKVIDENHQRLHFLTHPAWWTPEPMSPSRRIDRAIEGRARAVRVRYDQILAVAGRRNIV